MPSWTLIETHPNHGTTFQRPLDAFESGLVFLGRSNGNGDVLHHVELRLLNPSEGAHLFSEANITRAWLSTKRRFPLAGATVQALRDVPASPSGPELAGLRTEYGSDGSFPPEFRFVVREQELSVLHPNEIVFDQVARAEEVLQRMAAIWNGPRPLSDKLMVQLYVFRETDSQRSDVFHLMMLLSHCVTDGTSRRALMGRLLDSLARGGELDAELGQLPLEERLAMVAPSADLVPMELRSLSLARRRWRMAIGAVIVQLREDKLQGGHTLPCHRVRATSRPRHASTLLTKEQTTAVLANCRLHGLTFGNAYLPIAQVAMTRVLYRRYLHGEISEEEWTYRKRQPYHITGPFNLRRYLDKRWYECGGGGEFVACISTYNYQLPFMTLGATEPCQYRERELSDGAPPFADLLTFGRFLHRAGLVQKQARAYFSHPLFFEIVRAQSLVYTRHAALRWTKHVENLSNNSGMHEDSNKVTNLPVVIAHLWATMGNVDLILPTEYPLPPTHPLSPLSPIPHPARAGYTSPPPTDVRSTPRIVLENATSQINVSPGRLYLNSSSSHGQLEMQCFYDSHVYEEEMVNEWLDEVREAVLWYLGQTHR